MYSGRSRWVIMLTLRKKTRSFDCLKPPCFHEYCRIAPNRTSSCAHQTGTFSNVFDFVLYETFSHAADNVRATAKADRFDQCAIIDAEQMSVEQTRRLWFGERHETRPVEAGDTLIVRPI
jgi:hypothetical protein